jgi:hypothetical protein
MAEQRPPPSREQEPLQLQTTHSSASIHNLWRLLLSFIVLLFSNVRRTEEHRKPGEWWDSSVSIAHATPTVECSRAELLHRGPPIDPALLINTLCLLFLIFPMQPVRLYIKGTVMGYKR